MFPPLSIDENNTVRAIDAYADGLDLNQQAFDVLWFYYVEEFSIKEISQILHSSQSWVKMTLFRSKRKLAKNENIYTLFQQVLTAE